jgi:hypothetical protein
MWLSPTSRLSSCRFPNRLVPYKSSIKKETCKNISLVYKSSFHTQKYSQQQISCVDMQSIVFYKPRVLTSVNYNTEMVNSERFSLTTQFTVFTPKVSESKNKMNVAFANSSFPKRTCSLQIINKKKSRAKIYHKCIKVAFILKCTHNNGSHVSTCNQSCFRNHEC